ncbi:MAG: ABC-F family ATP-binding cassette domain-containing protein, partial [Lachnospiraceae bacterium]|nr:ABC-F family ATP-binding cassette domain-containing protein [Lachnospiraceae bacterium]
MLEMKDITLRLKREDRILAERFSFTLMKGDKAVLIGEEGNGKSTLLKYIFDPLSVEGYCEGEGTVIAHGRLGYLPQSMEDGLASLTLQEYFEPYEHYSHTDVLVQLGIKPEFLRSLQPLGSLSGGEKVKAQLCRILMEEPDILLLDEPTNHLDIHALQWLETYLLNYPGAVFVISHDRYFLDRTVQVIIDLSQGVTSVFQGNYSEYIVKKRAVWNARIREYEKQQREIRHQEEVIAKLRSFNREKSIKRAESREKMLDKIERIEKPTEVDTEMKLTLTPR